MGLFNAIGSVLGFDNSSEAMGAIQGGANAAAGMSQKMYEQARADLKPYREAGEWALPKMQDNDYYRDFTMADFNADPGYQFRVDEANKALERSAAAKGGLMSGATLRGIAGLNQNLASQEYAAARNRFINDRDVRFGRLSGIATMGQNSAAASASQAMQHGQSMSDLYTGLGNAQAAQQIARGNSAANTMGQMVGLGTAIFCDERLKEDIEPVSVEDLAEMRAHLKAVRFHYKNEEHGKGDYVGVLAQDLEKSKLGKTLVKHDAHGNKVIDPNRVLMLFLATQAEA